jgi:hypothetical protein
MYFASIAILALTLALGVRRMRRHGAGKLGDRAATRSHLEFLVEEQQRADEAQRQRSEPR